MAKINQNISGLSYRTPFVVGASPLTDNVDKVKEAEDNGAGAASLKLTLLEQPRPGIRQMYTERGYRMFNPSDKRNNMDRGLDLMRRSKEAISDIVLWANIAGPGDNLEGWAKIALEMEQAGADALELNFICPNMSLAASSMGKTVNEKKLGALVGKDPGLIRAIVKAVKASVQIPVWTKMTSEVEDYLSVVRAARDGGADGLTVTGAPLVAPPINIRNHGRPKMATLNGRCSFGGAGGPMLRPLSGRLIAQTALDMDIPIAGGGGLETYEHAIEAIMFGASLVSYCYRFLVDGFGVLPGMISGLKRFMDENGYETIGDMRGEALQYICTTAELENIPSYAMIDRETCTGCGQCAKIGSCSAISLEDRKAKADPQECEGCGLCQSVCPRGCISFTPRTVRA